MGAWGTPLMYAFGEREKILDLFESLAGSRMMCDYMRFGGCRLDASEEWLAPGEKIVDRFPGIFSEVEGLIFCHANVLCRTPQDCETSPPFAINTRSTGPLV